MALLFLAWKHGGENPYQLFNGLGPDFRSWADPEGGPRLPPHPSRVRNVIYAFAAFANEVESGKPQQQRRG